MRHHLLWLLLCACPPVLPRVDAGPTVAPSWKHAHTPPFWNEAKGAHADFVGTDRLTDLASTFGP